MFPTLLAGKEGELLEKDCWRGTIKGQGEGFVGTIIKDTWTITGVLGVRLGWGEKAENCT